MTIITLDNLQTLFATTPANTLAQYVDILNTQLPIYEINTNKRVAMFLAQIGVESGYFQYREGNFNFSAKSLMAVFPKYFPTLEVAEEYAHKPEKIVLKVYSDRMGNGPASTGDAWTYRERGLIQLCGKDNYEAYAKYKKMTVPDVITYLETLEGAVDVACWYWEKGKLNTFADEGNLPGATKVINGGQEGLVLRAALYFKALTIFP